MSILGSIFGNSKTTTTSVKEMLQNGAAIIDVRTRGEFQGGHVKGSKNIPLQEIQKRVDDIKKMKVPVVLCCASGGRSGQAANFLQQQGVDCINGGGWMQVNALV